MEKADRRNENGSSEANSNNDNNRDGNMSDTSNVNNSVQVENSLAHIDGTHG